MVHSTAPAARLLLAVVALLAACTHSAVGQSAAVADSSIKNLVVFGDSLSDSQGNFLKFSKGKYPDPKWYLGGRSAGGPMWPNYVATWLRLGLKNYAYLGAMACPAPDKAIDETGLITSPDGLDQVGAYLGATKPDQVSKNIHVLFLGSNDYFSYLLRVALGLVNPFTTPPPPPSKVVGCVGAAAKALLKKGAKVLVISDTAPVHLSPAITKAEQRAGIKAFVDGHSALVQALVANLTKAYPKAKIAYLPTAKAASDVYVQYKKYGMISNNVTALKLDVPSTSYPFIVPSALRRQSKKYYWFDNAHPTSSVHRVLSRVYLSVIAQFL